MLKIFVVRKSSNISALQATQKIGSPWFAKVLFCTASSDYVQAANGLNRKSCSFQIMFTSFLMMDGSKNPSPMKKMQTPSGISIVPLESAFVRNYLCKFWDSLKRWSKTFFCFSWFFRSNKYVEFYTKESSRLYVREFWPLNSDDGCSFFIRRREKANSALLCSV